MSSIVQYNGDGLEETSTHHGSGPTYSLINSEFLFTHGRRTLDPYFSLFMFSFVNERNLNSSISSSISAVIHLARAQVEAQNFCSMFHPSGDSLFRASASSAGPANTSISVKSSGHSLFECRFNRRGGRSKSVAVNLSI